MFALTVPNVYTNIECENLITILQQQPAVVNQEKEVAILEKNNQNSYRFIINNPNLAEELFDRLKPDLPTIYQGKTLLGLNTRFQFLKYQPDQYFKQHLEECYTSDPSQRLLIVILYLNNVEAGGETILYDNKIEEPYSKIICKSGKVLVFDHDWFYQDMAVIRGIKYCVRTDVMYEN